MSYYTARAEHLLVSMPLSSVNITLLLRNSFGTVTINLSDDDRYLYIH